MLTLTNLTSLPSLLPLTTLTALLLTAEWSVDTLAARKTLSKAGALSDCHSIQFLEFPITPPFLHSSSVGEHLRTAGLADADHEYLRNATSDPPYLPHLRVIQRVDDNVTIFPYKDAFDPLSVARFIATLCHLPFPNVASRDSIAVALREGRKAAVIVDEQPFTPAWNLTFDALAARSDWVVGYADPDDQIFRQRHRADSPAVVLMDRSRDAYETVALRGMQTLDLERAAAGFEDRVRETDHIVDKQELMYFQEPFAWRQCFQNTSPRGLDGWLGHTTKKGEGESFLWVFVIAPWCAFCQRSVPEFERFVSIVQRIPGVHGVIVEAESLPRFMDQLVDGFPTILMVREIGTWTGVQEYLGVRDVDGFVGMHYGKVESEMRRIAELGV